MDTSTQPERQHPGTIEFIDEVDSVRYIKNANELPQTIAWVRVESACYPVTKIVITGTRNKRRISKFGVDGTLLESTIER